MFNTVTPQFWADKKVLITGNTGFKGSWLTIWLHYMGAKIFGYALEPDGRNFLWQELKLESLCTKFKYADICDYHALENFIIETKPDIVIHMAAQPLVKYSYDFPRETYAVNVMGAINLLDAIRVNHINTVIVNVTTDKCYDNKEWIWAYRENDVIGGHDPYSNSKGCSELITSAFIKSYFHEGHPVKLASARAGNVVGGGDWSENRLIPDIIRNLHNNQNIELHNPQSVRPWQHVLDSLSGYLILSEHLYKHGHKFSGSWNFGPNNYVTKTVKDIANNLIALWKSNVQVLHDESQSSVHEAQTLRLDCTKSNVLLNWAPVWNIDDTLQNTVSWYKAYFEQQDMFEFTQQQIKSYCATQNCVRGI